MPIDPRILMPDISVTIRTSEAGDPRPSPNTWTKIGMNHVAVGRVGVSGADMSATVTYAQQSPFPPATVPGMAVTPPNGYDWAFSFFGLPADKDVSLVVTATYGGDVGSKRANSKTAP